MSKEYFESFGRPLFSERFPDVYGLLCFGLCGPGSECYGFDDEISRDHDFEPGFCVFYPEEQLSRRRVFELERAYAGLPSEFGGLRRSPVRSYGGIERRGVIGINDYYSRYLGDVGIPVSIDEWLNIPEERLCEAVNGTVFVDNLGEFSRRRQLLSAMPRDVQIKRLAGRLFELSQDGGYNYLRALKRADGAQARLFLDDFVTGAAAVIYLLNGMYRPYRKWLLRGLERCARLGELRDQLTGMLISPAQDAADAVETLSRVLSNAALEQFGLKLNEAGGYSGFDMLQSAAFALNGIIADNYLRNSDILYAL